MIMTAREYPEILHVAERLKDTLEKIEQADYQNEHPDDAKAYEILKKDLCARFPDDRNSYVKGKEEMIDDILDKANRCLQSRRLMI